MKWFVVILGLVVGVSSVCAAAEGADVKPAKKAARRGERTDMRLRERTEGQKSVTQDDEQICKKLLDRYVQAWIGGDAEGMQSCFASNSIPLSTFTSKIKYETEAKKRPEKFASFIGMSVPEKDVLEMYFRLETQAGIQRYTARLSRIEGADWKISSAELRVPQEVADALRQKVKAYVDAWIEGSAAKMFVCMDGVNMTEAEFVNAVQGKLADEVKPTRLEHMGLARFDNNGAIQVLYVVSVQDKRDKLEKHTAIFTFDKEQNKWKFVGNGNTPAAKK